MVIFFCDRCGNRVPDADIAAGRAVRREENHVVCASCAAMGARSGHTGPVHTLQSDPLPDDEEADAPVHAHAPIARTTGKGTAIQAHPHQHPPAKKPGIKNTTLYACAGAAAAFLIVVLIFTFGRKKPESKTAASSEPAPTVPDVRRDTPSVKPDEPKPPDAVKPPVEVPPQPTPQPTPVVDDMASIRDQRAARLLQEYKDQFAKNPDDSQTYASRLKELVRTYGSTPAGAEARNLLATVKVEAPPDRLLSAAPEAKDFQLVYDLDLGKLSKSITYDQDQHAAITQPFDRIAYFIELQTNDGPQWLFVSMDAFTAEIGKIGVPGPGVSFQMNVANMNVYTNVAGITTGTGITGGNIEFWPSNYGTKNVASVPNADSGKYDFGDEQSAQGQEGHGSMQVHNHDAKQVLFAVNCWRAGPSAEIGIGNNPNGNPDWTFAKNGTSYRSKRLRVLVHLK